MGSTIQAMNVITYWEGPKPPLIHVLHRLMHLHINSAERTNQKNRFHCITQGEFLSGKSKSYCNYFTRLHPAFQADIVRVEYIHRNGGIWIDSDTLLMSSLNTLQKILQAKHGFFITERGKNGTKLCNGVFGSKSGTPLLSAWKKIIDGYIDRQALPRHGELGFRCLTRLLINNESLFSQYIVFDGEKTMYPVAWHESQEVFLSKASILPSAIKRDFQPLIILLNGVYNNYDGLYVNNGKECALDFYIQNSLKNLVVDSPINTEYSTKEIDRFEYDREQLKTMAQNFVQRWSKHTVFDPASDTN